MIPAVAPLLLGIAAVILRTFGPGYRVGRLLAVAPRVSVAEAVQLAERGMAGYLRIEGRIDSDAEFEDADHRPLVMRRTTIDWQPPAGDGPWARFDQRLEVVPFVIREGLDDIAVDAGSIADGLVTVPRESTGLAGELEEMTAAGIDPKARVRMRVELVSSVEHATVLGVPVRAANGGAVIGPGMGRPLILSTLEGDEAMRALSGGGTGRSRVAVACIALGLALIAVAVLWWVADALIGGGAATALAASPEPSLRPGTDTRSSGSGPGLVGEPRGDVDRLAVDVAEPDEHRPESHPRVDGRQLLVALVGLDRVEGDVDSGAGRVRDVENPVAQRLDDPAADRRHPQRNVPFEPLEGPLELRGVPASARAGEVDEVDKSDSEHRHPVVPRSRERPGDRCRELPAPHEEHQLLQPWHHNLRSGGGGPKHLVHRQTAGERPEDVDLGLGKPGQPLTHRARHDQQGVLVDHPELEQRHGSAQGLDIAVGEGDLAVGDVGETHRRPHRPGGVQGHPRPLRDLLARQRRRLTQQHALEVLHAAQPMGAHARDPAYRRCHER